MINISTLLVFTILWHHGGSGVVLQSCPSMIDEIDATVVRLIMCSFSLYL
jgi:hypothetical protein